MNILSDLLEQLYSDSGRIRILTDIYGKVYWHNMKNRMEPTVYFPEDIPYNISDGDTVKISVDAMPLSAECSILHSQSGTYYLWTTKTLRHLLLSLGSTQTYEETTHLIGMTKSNLKEILSLSDLLATAPQNAETIKITDRQKRKCFELLEQLEIMNMLASIIYKKADRNRIINTAEEMYLLTKECNRQLSRGGLSVELICTSSTSNANIRAGKQMFYILMLSLIKRMIKTGNASSDTG